MDETGHVSRQPDMELLRRELYAVSITDAETRQTIKEAYQKYGTLLEPHGAVGFAGLMKYLGRVRRLEPLHIPGDRGPGQVPG